MGESEDDDNDDDDAVENEGSGDDDDDIQTVNSRKRNKLPATDFEQEDSGHSDDEKNRNFLGDELESNYDGGDYDDDDEEEEEKEEVEVEEGEEELEDDEGSDAIQNFSATSLSEDVEKGKAARNQLSK